jgi:hypothetical protein
MRRDQRAKLRHRGRQIARVAVLHRQAVARETVGWGSAPPCSSGSLTGCLSSLVLLYLRNGVPLLSCREGRAARPTARAPPCCRWAMPGTASAAPIPASPGNPTRSLCSPSATWATPADAARAFPTATDPTRRASPSRGWPGNLRVYYVLERDHRPFAHGPLEFSRAGGSMAGESASESTSGWRAPTWRAICGEFRKLRRADRHQDRMEGKPVRDSISEYSELALPNDANGHGNLLGGRVMHLVDLAGAMAAMRHARSPWSRRRWTASISSIRCIFRSW